MKRFTGLASAVALALGASACSQPDADAAVGSSRTSDLIVTMDRAEDKIEDKLEILGGDRNDSPTVAANPVKNGAPPTKRAEAAAQGELPVTNKSPISEPILVVETEPRGAEVEVGLRFVNSVLTAGTGRSVGRTPVQIELRPSDVTVDASGNAGLYYTVRLEGYQDLTDLINLGKEGKLKPGQTYRLSVARLARLQPR